MTVRYTPCYVSTRPVPQQAHYLFSPHPQNNVKGKRDHLLHWNVAHGLATRRRAF